MENTISFNDLPNAVMDLSRKMDILLSRATEQQIDDEDKLFSIEELIDYLPEHPARQTVYGWVNSRLIEFEKYGKRLYFRKSTINFWLANGRQIKNR